MAVGRRMEAGFAVSGRRLVCGACERRPADESEGKVTSANQIPPVGVLPHRIKAAARPTPGELRDAAKDSFARWIERGDPRDLEVSQVLEQRARTLELKTEVAE